MKKYLLPILLLLSAATLAAQPDTVRLGHLLRGTVVDSRTGRPIESVHVSVPDRHYATVTNADGVFTLKSDIPIVEAVFSYVGYRTVRRKVGDGTLMVRLVREQAQLDEAVIVSGDPLQLVRAAVSRIPDHSSPRPELLEGFYRETIRKRQRFTCISEAVVRLYKVPYDGSVIRDRVALEKSRILLSQKRSDTLGVKVMGGPAQAVTFDVVRNGDLLFDEDELALYRFELAPPVYIDDRPQLVIQLHPAADCAYALYHGTLYIDRDRLSFTRIELSLDMSDPAKATRMMLVKKPFSLRFTPKEMSIVASYRTVDGVNRLGYFRSTLRFSCDWKRRLFATTYTAVNELVVTDLREPPVPITRAETFRSKDILSDKAGEFLDPDFWDGYNIIEPTESLEHAISRLRKR